MGSEIYTETLEMGSEIYTDTLEMCHRLNKWCLRYAPVNELLSRSIPQFVFVTAHSYLVIQTTSYIDELFPLKMSTY